MLRFGLWRAVGIIGHDVGKHAFPTSVADLEVRCDNETSTKGPHAMPNRPQFSLKAILVIIAILSVPLGMIATRKSSWVICGVGFLAVAISVSVSYLTRRWRGTLAYLMIEFVLVSFIAAAVVMALVFG